jgi:hypothetical protein
MRLAAGTELAAPRGLSRLPGSDRPLGRALRLLAYAAPLVLLTAFDRPVCVYALVFRSPCPGCGLTRAALALAAGDLAAAARWNPLAIVVCPVAVALVGYGAAHYLWTGRIGLGSPWITRAVVVLSAALVVIWVARTFGAFGGPVPV